MSPFVMDSAGWLGARGDIGSNPGPGSGNPFFKAATNSTSQQMIINQFRFAAAKSIRSSTIILATFNAIAAFATAMGILYDNYSRARRNDRDFKFSRHGFSFVRPGETYPLMLSIGILIQSTTFALAQSTGMEQFFTTGCTLLSQVMLPAVFLAPYIQLVFAVEITMRALRKKPFPPRGKWTVAICVTVIGLLTLTNFLVADFVRVRDFCFASLFFFIAKYGTGCFAVLTAITSILIVCAVIIFVRLHRSTKIEVTERVTGSRMVYYLALAAISNIFMLPFFFCLAFPDKESSKMNDQTLTLSMVASVVANVSGVMTGGLYLFLKSNVLSTIGPKDKFGEYERRKLKHTIRRYGPADEDGDDSLSARVSGSGALRRMDSDASFISTDKELESGESIRSSPAPSIASSRRLNPLRSNAFYPPVSAPRFPEPAQTPTGVIGHMRKRSYNIFPSLPGSKSSVTLLPATTYSPQYNGRAKDAESALDSLKPPPSLRNLVGRHRRDSSMVSSATVQIGLRLSSVDDMPARPTTAEADVISLNCPKILAKLSPLRPGPVASESPDAGAEAIVDASPKRDPVKNARMKTLPPVPNRAGDATEGEDEDDEEGEMLSPHVYSPGSPGKVASPLGVGIAMPAARYNHGRPASPPAAAPVSADAKAEWI